MKRGTLTMQFGGAGIKISNFQLKLLQNKALNLSKMDSLNFFHRNKLYT